MNIMNELTIEEVRRLGGAGACLRFRVEFLEKFGEKATIPELYQWLKQEHKQEHLDWLVELIGLDKNLSTALLNQGADVNMIEGDDGWTPLHYAVVFSNMEMVEFLVEKGADINVTSNNGRTPLFFANYRDNIEMIKFLKSKGAK